MNEIKLPKFALDISNDKKLDTKIKSNGNKSSNAAVVTKSTDEPAVVYEASDAKDILKNYDKQGHIYNKSRIDELKSESDVKLSGLRDAVKSMIESQGHKFEDIMNLLNDPSNINENGNLVDENGNEIIIKIDDETKQNAIESISEDGYYGVEKTSARMIEFAKVISGNDPSKVDSLKEAISDGFEAAKDIFGGELPEISQKTYDAVMEGLDKWASGDQTNEVNNSSAKSRDSRIK
ncbi:MAG: hypothetical protein WBA54_04095 [Acidaminobacteraceae bacterium]